MLPASRNVGCRFVCPKRHFTLAEKRKRSGASNSRSSGPHFLQTLARWSPRNTATCRSLQRSQSTTSLNSSSSSPTLSSLSSSKAPTPSHPIDDWIVHPDLVDHLGSCLASTELTPSQCHHSGFSICCLGTGAGRPSTRRNNAATALRMGSTTFLFDAGEGVQLQLMVSRLKFGDIRKILITHLHGDHIFGLPGLVLHLDIVAKLSEEAKHQRVEIYGPVGLYNFLATSLSLSYSILGSITVEVYEFQRGDAARTDRRRGGGPQQRWKHPGAASTFPEFNHPRLIRKALPQKEDGTWSISEAEEVKTEEDALKWGGHGRHPQILAAEISHKPKLDCFGYLVREPFTQPRKIDSERAIARGVKPDKRYQVLKFGFPVLSDDGERWIQPDDVLIGNIVKPRSLALLGDCCHIPEPMSSLCQNVDVLVHEATLSQKDVGGKAVFGGHSTAFAAGQFAHRAAVKVLLLNHISPSAHSPVEEQDLVDEAERAIEEGHTRVQMSYDHLEIAVPPGGFDFGT